MVDWFWLGSDQPSKLRAGMLTFRCIVVCQNMKNSCQQIEVVGKFLTKTAFFWDYETNAQEFMLKTSFY